MAEILTQLRGGNHPVESITDDEFAKILNREPGKLTGYDCPKCRNRGYFWHFRDGYRFIQDCDCMEVRESLKRIQESGLQDVMERQTFASFQCPQPWQADIKRRVMRFVKDEGRDWLLLSGQPGSGKTHLCTAAAGSFLKAGMSVRYMLWVDDSTRMKACVNDEEYFRQINPLKTCKVLYIDDFFKRKETDGKKDDFSQADIRLAFEIINHRYANRLTTIISTERTPGELFRIDEGTGSRIYERTKAYQLVINYDRDKNWRLQPHESES